MDARHPLQAQGVGGHLHHHMGAARVRHGAEERLEFKGLRGGALRVEHLPADHVLVGADEAHLGTQRLLQHVLEQVGGGGLAVGAGDAHHGHGGGRVAVPVPAHPGQSAPAVVRDHPGALPLRPVLAEDAERALLPGHGDELVPVSLIALHGHKEVSGPCFPGIVADAGNLHIKVRAGLQNLDSLQQFSQLHRTKTCSLIVFRQNSALPKSSF